MTAKIIGTGSAVPAYCMKIMILQNLLIPVMNGL